MSEARTPLTNWDPSKIEDPQIRDLFAGLLNLVETLKSENRTLREENQRLRDEIQRLKGEHGKPKIRPQKKADAETSDDLSSEKERSVPKAWRKSPKVGSISIDRTETLTLDRRSLPDDAVFKGYEEVVVQDLAIRTDNVLFRKEKYHSPSLGKTYLAELPEGYRGEFGPGIKALALSLAFGGNMTEPKLRELLNHVGVSISAGGLSNLLIGDHERFHREKAAVYEAGLSSGPWHHFDQTGTRVNGTNHQCHIVCNPLYSAYFTLPGKDRLSVLEALRGGRPPEFLLNEEALAELTAGGLARRILERLSVMPQGEPLDEARTLEWLDSQVSGLGPKQRRSIMEAMALAAYRNDPRRIPLMVADNAPQFPGIAEELALCWVHEGRLYKKLLPYVPYHKTLLAKFLGEFWDYYRELRAFQDRALKDSLDSEEALRLSLAFDRLFGRTTGYQELDERIVLTRGKKADMLRVLEHPEVPLHNNPAELAARRRVMKRRTSFGPRTPEGMRAWDTFMSLAATAAKLGISFYRYIKDRLSGIGEIPPLDQVIRRQASGLHLGASWVT